MREAGPSDAPAVVLIHGWASSGEVWDLPGFHTYALDLRGHGLSDDFGDYRSSEQWAADLRAVLDHTGSATLVGWSYGGLVISDYLRFHGTDLVRSLMFVGAITEIGRGRPGGATGAVMQAALPAALTDDDALRAFFAAWELPAETAEKLTSIASKVPPRVRGELFRRDVDSADVLAAIDVPTLVVHGKADRVVAPSAAEYAAAKIPGAELTWYDAGHAPFVERQGEFARDLERIVA